MAKPHLVHIIPTLSIGGAERVVVNLSNQLRGEFKISIVILKNNKELAQELHSDINLSVIEKKSKLGLSLFSSLQTWLKKNSADLVHTHLFGGDFWGRIAANRAGIPVVTTEHNLNVTESFLKDWIKKYLRNYSKIYTAPSQAVADYMQSSYSIAEEKIKVIPHGIKLEKFEHTQPYLQRDLLKLLMLGRLHKQKGHDIALEALAKINSNKWKLNIVGSGEKFSETKEKISELNLEDNVEIWDSTLDVVAEYNSHDVVLMPSRWEGLGLTAMEAMASGRLVIGSNVDGLKEFIINGENGLLFRPEDPENLAQKIRYCLDNPQECNEIASKARQYAQDRFKLQDMINKYHQLYQKILS
jgi:glycosyltransferase involved in cell wall biosynthesis